MKKKAVYVLLALMFVIGAAIGTITVTTASTWDEPRPYNINKNGQTYGGLNPYSAIPQEKPDLIAAIGIDGTEGYVYSSDLNEGQPTNPEEAAKYMEDLEQKVAQARITGEKFSRYIPLYDSDGTTIIGEFGISLPYDSDGTTIIEEFGISLPDVD